mmetsp:Transcript_104565/g.181617  ORF Transcript_104565/g.181617 Transcript_104565/m.181617 type:complete len:279 (-) Transcript_104565:716-1552(-)
MKAAVLQGHAAASWQLYSSTKRGLNHSSSSLGFASSSACASCSAGLANQDGATSVALIAEALTTSCSLRPRFSKPLSRKKSSPSERTVHPLASVLVAYQFDDTDPRTSAAMSEWAMSESPAVPLPGDITCRGERHMEDAGEADFQLLLVFLMLSTPGDEATAGDASWTSWTVITGTSSAILTGVSEPVSSGNSRALPSFEAGLITGVGIVTCRCDGLAGASGLAETSWFSVGVTSAAIGFGIDSELGEASCGAGFDAVAPDPAVCLQLGCTSSEGATT